ncbi:TPA: hypothetical protein ACN12I_002898, partial [Staphylococcus aureus]
MPEASHINGIRVTIPAGNSYPYYQDKKKLVSLASKPSTLKKAIPRESNKKFKTILKKIQPIKYLERRCFYAIYIFTYSNNNR